jgi:hypothetical protein
VDTISNPSNQWQIGSPVKNVFNEPFPSKVIVTDTVNSYAPNDTSSFILKIARPFLFGQGNVFASLQFKYKLDKDSLDMLKVEVAADTAMHWINMLTEDTTYQIGWYGNKPNFEDTSTQWKTFRANFSFWFSTYYGQANFPYYADADTFKFRFTFISDSVQTNRDGCMIDSVECLFAVLESTSNAYSNDAIIQFYPNPTKDILQIRRPTKTDDAEYIFIYSLDGRLINTYNITKKDFIHLALPKGMYLIHYKCGDKTMQEKITIQ